MSKYSNHAVKRRGNYNHSQSLTSTVNKLHSISFFSYSAFDTPTGMPYGTVNLRYGIPPSETPITCTAGCGTFIVEFGTISALTGTECVKFPFSV